MALTTYIDERVAVQKLHDMIAGFDLDDLARMCSELSEYDDTWVVVRGDEQATGYSGIFQRGICIGEYEHDAEDKA